MRRRRKMANRIHLFSVNGFLKNLAKYTALGVLAFGIWKGSELGGKAIDEFRDSRKIGKVEELIKDKKFDDAEKLIGAYREKGSLEEPEVLALDMELEDSRKGARVGELDGLIRSGNYDASCKRFEELKQRGDIGESEEPSYYEKLNDISLEGRVKKLGKLEGRDKISQIDALLKNYPNYENANDLRSEQLRVYQEMSFGRLRNGADNNDTLALLEEFYSWIKERDFGLIQKLDVDSLKDARDKYYEKVVEQKEKLVREDASIHVGDKVKIVKKLGPLLNDPGGYYVQGDYDNIPIGSTGMVVVESDNSTPYKVKIDNTENTVEWFAVREVEKIYTEKDNSKFREIREAIGKIIDVYNVNAGGNTNGP